MSTQDSPVTLSRGGASKKCAASRLFACGAAIVALSGALLAALGNTGCGTCHEAGASLPGIPIAWAGVAFYVPLLAAAAWSGLSRTTRAGFLVASGVHVVLLCLLAWQHLFCGACLLAASGAISGGVASIVVPPRPMRWAAAPFALAALAAMAGIYAAGPSRGMHAQPLPALTMPSSAGASGESAATQTSHVKLYVYERDGCGHCVTFEEVVLPEVEKAFGGKLDVERLEPAIDQETPTIIVQGQGQKEFVGVPDAKELVDTIRALQ